MSNSIFELLNRNCRCINTDLAALERETERVLGESGLTLPTWADTNVFAATPVFVSPEHVRIMREVVSAATALTRSPSYHSMALERAPEIARHPVSHRSVFFGYDFHLGVNGPALIEINTNAGGAMLNLLLARAQKPCCEEVNQFVTSAHRVEALDARLVQMFRDEWMLARGDQALGTIAIVDDDPESQFLYPEFVLFRALFHQAGLKAFICSPEQLRFESSGLYFENQRADLVYNRLVDFCLEEPRHVALRNAYLADAAVVTPHPQAHAILADKRNLISLRDAEQHLAAGLTSNQSQLLVAHIPETQLVCAENAYQLWSERKQWFFKPIRGYGSKATYRGDKLTHATFERVLRATNWPSGLWTKSPARRCPGAIVVKSSSMCFVVSRTTARSSRSPLDCITVRQPTSERQVEASRLSSRWRPSSDVVCICTCCKTFVN